VWLIVGDKRCDPQTWLPKPQRMGFWGLRSSQGALSEKSRSI
jgi:hypothetical protein